MSRHLFLPFFGTTFKGEITLGLVEHLLIILSFTRALISEFKITLAHGLTVYLVSHMKVVQK